MRLLILVRHGETRKNLLSNLHSSDDPESLNKTGIDQIEKTALVLKEYLPFNLYSSIKRRAVESAKIISEINNVPVNFIEGMEERNWGVYSGKPWDDVSKILDPLSLEERFNFVPKNGESWKAFEIRLIKALKRVLTTQDKNIVIVTHGGSIRALLPFLLNTSKDESFKFDPANASLTIFEIKKHQFRKIVIADTSHLE